MELADGAREDAPDALSVIDVSGVPGAEIVVQRGWTMPPLGSEGRATTAAVACVLAPSDRWAPGMEDLVLARATAIAQRAAAVDAARWAPSAIHALGPRFEQRIAGAAKRDGAPASVDLRHLLGFAGERRDVLLCTLLCVGPEHDPRCPAFIEAAEPVGSFEAPPPPGLVIRAILLAAERPYGAAILLAIMAVALVALVLHRRPRTP